MNFEIHDSARRMACAVVLAGCSAAAQAQAAWPAAQTNPAAKPDDVVLPMPCGDIAT